MSLGYGLNDEMFNSQRVNFHSFDGNKNGSPKEHKFRVLPAYAPNKLFHKVGLHWGFKTADGKQKALTCTLEESGTCPICDRVNYLKGQLENIEAALTTQFDPQERAKLESQKAEIQEYVSDHRRKPMYLWNIVTEGGEQKVLQLSWNGHDPLHEKIKFIFSQQKIDVTSATNNYLMYCNRSGLKAKTRYQYEMLAGFEKDITTEVTQLTDLSKVYVPKSLEYLKKVVDTEMIPADQEDPNDRNFDAQQSNRQEPPQNAQVPMGNQNAQHVGSEKTSSSQMGHSQVGQEANMSAQTASHSNTQNTQVDSSPQNTVDQPVNTSQDSAPVEQTQVQLTDEQDKNVAEMMAALNS